MSTIVAVTEGKGANLRITDGKRHLTEDALRGSEILCSKLRDAVIAAHPEVDAKDGKALAALAHGYRRSNRWKHNPAATPACERCAECWRKYNSGERASLVSGERFAGKDAAFHATSIALDAPARARAAALKAVTKKDAAAGDALRARIEDARKRMS